MVVFGRILFLFIDLCYFDIVIWAQFITYRWWAVSGSSSLDFLAYYYDVFCHVLPGPLMLLIVGFRVISGWHKDVSLQWSFLLCLSLVLIATLHVCFKFWYATLRSIMSTPTPEFRLTY
jgi:hypothetical protein